MAREYHACTLRLQEVCGLYMVIRLQDNMQIEHLRHLPTNPTVQMSRSILS